MTRELKLAYIETKLIEWGEFLISDVENEEPILFKAYSNCVDVIKGFNKDSVAITTCTSDSEIDWNEVPYNGLPDDILDEVIRVVENYDAQETKIFNGVRDEDF